MNEQLQQRIDELPRKSGVYIMRGESGNIIYIGKATDLRSRVRSYFSGSDPRAFVQHLDELLFAVDVIVTTNPKEALLLENTLIKKHKPRFNIMLRDDKNYLSLRIDVRHPWPRVDVVRAIRADGAKYFGPYHSASKVRRTLAVLNRFFQLRTCSDRVLGNRARPCLQFQIKRCPAPCVNEVSADEYADNVRDAMLFLDGKEPELTKSLMERMHQAAARTEYETAAMYRDAIQAVRDSLVDQHAVLTTLKDRDVIGWARDGETAVVCVCRYRNGRLDDVATQTFEQQMFPDAEVMSSFLSQMYGRREGEVPEEILLSVGVADMRDLEAALTELRGTRCHVRIPQRGEGKSLIAVANDNATNLLVDATSTALRGVRASERLHRLLHLRSVPRTIECYDISNFQGEAIVASQVTFQDGIPDRDAYRKYRIRTTQIQDDFASMFEVLSRRAKSSKKDGGRPMPDLIVIDGGKGQLNQAVTALRELGIDNQEVISLAKSRLKAPTERDAELERSPERVFVPGHKNAIVLPQHSDACLLLRRVRDEAHRVAITYHRKLRGKQRLRSELDDIPGIGESRRKLLLKHFGSVHAIRGASLTDLEAVPGLGRGLAFGVFDTFHPNEANAPAMGPDT